MTAGKVVIVRHYDSADSAQEAVDALEGAGIGEEAVGLLTREGVTGHFHPPAGTNPNDMSAREGATLGTLAGLVTGVAALATPLGPLIAAGPLFGALIGALAGAATGGIVAALVEAGLSEEDARRLAATLEDDDAVLLSVEVPRARAAEVRALLGRVEALHEADLAHFRAHHESVGGTDFESANAAYRFGYRAAAEQAGTFETLAPTLASSYPGDFDADREAIAAGFRRYRQTIQVLDAFGP